ncbi:FkbM family methyltransferase [Novosphingobium sp. ERN07]|uniref:FkbM family methyltransferase n=1 Tax=Novosphingobium sp. ERN07 TaxID=2726187 RepID=UPI0014569FEF|nr:FkbM family methyltransferase [Novosphingobium sp. ERN07]NLR72477.1 FkbM family methyltransferase [Novosphingobium sp. ERN07]
MDYLAFSQRNLVAREATRHKAFASSEIERCNYELGYRGFVNCKAAQGEQSFVMFNNADDVVAGHYMYAGPASFETGTLKLWCHLARQAQWIYDIGAFTGVFALAAIAANPASRVMAFEPSFVTYSRMLVNIAANGFGGHIAPLRAGLGSMESELDLQHPSGVYVMSSDETFVEGKIADAWFTEKVALFRLDHLLANQERYRREIVISTHFAGADLIKIDVEGFETEVIAGMKATIAAHRPCVIVECLDDNDQILDTPVVRARIATLMDQFGPGYQVRHIDEASGRFSDDIRGRNNLFIHEDRLDLIDGYSGYDD